MEETKQEAEEKPKEEIKEEPQVITEEIPEEEPWYRGPLRIILSLFLLLLIVMWTFSYYGGRIDPEPTRIPTKAEVLPPNIILENKTIQIQTRNDFQKAITPSDPLIKQTADRIASLSCDGNRVCQAKAIYYFVRDNYEYISDPTRKEYIKDPKELLETGGGDCEDGAILTASLLESIGVTTELVFIPGHALLRVLLPEASKGYKINDFIYLDWTCKECNFGEIPLNVKKQI
jgi:transglutaminase-like putative cysteine protease